MAKSNFQRKPRAPAAPADETKRAKFLRLANKRVPAALQKIGLIGNLSTSGYEYHEHDIVAIRNALAKAVGDVLAKFAPRQPEIGRASCRGTV